MNITNLELTQATVDMFFCFFCVIMSVTLKANNPRYKSMKMFIKLFLVAALLFLGEAFAYIFRGNLGLFNITVTKLANLLVFVMNIALSNLYVRYIYAVVKDKNVEVNGRALKVANVLSCINLVIVAVNLVYPWMYYFDEANYYHRNNVWYVYTVLSIVVLFVGTGTGIKYRKALDIRKFVSTVIFAFIPIAATILQLFIYGVAITNVGIGLGLLILFVVYMYDWTHDNEDHLEQMKNKKIDVIILFAIMLLSMSASIIACARIIQQVSQDNSAMQSQTIAQMVGAEIENEFIKPITVAQTISEDLSIREYVKGESKEEAEAVAAGMAEQLESIRTGFGYQMVFAVSDKSKAYYTYNGISKYIDVVNDSHDIWYKEFMDSIHNMRIITVI